LEVKFMPNAKVLSEKQAIVAELTEKVRGAAAGVFVNYSGITVAEDNEMRRKLREANVDYAVVKNTLVRFAINSCGYEALDPILNGETAMAVSADPIAPAKVLSEYAKKFQNHFEIKAGFMDGKVLSVAEVNALAEIPPLPILRAQVLGTMLAPITSLAVVIKAIAEAQGAPAEAEAPAAE
jgi:large subunit ribosomal protein L10